MADGDRKLSITAAPRPDSKRWPPLDPLTWPELVAWLDLAHPADHKECGGYVLGELKGERRLAATVLTRSAVALDSDHASQAFALDSATELGCALAMYTTWRHTPSEPRWRLLAPLSRDVTPGEYRLIVQALMVELGFEQFDTGSAQPERFMYRPSTQGMYECHVTPGEPLDSDAWLTRAKELGLENEPEAEPYIDPSPARSPAEGVHPYAAKAIRDELAKLDDLPYPWHKDSFWDQTTFNVACNLVEFANSNWSGYSLADAQADLFEHAPADDRWGRKQHLSKWLSALNRVGPGARPAPAGNSADDFVQMMEEADSDDGRAQIRAQFPLLDLVGLLDPDRPPRSWVWEGVVPTGDHASFVAPPGVGKSLLTLALCLALVRGEESFIGLALSFGPDARVLYIDMENSEDDWAERLRDLGMTQHEARTLLGTRFLPLSLPRLGGLDTARGAEALMAVIDAYGVKDDDLVVLDSTQRVTEGEENSNDTMRKLYGHTVVELKRRNLTVIRTDNTGWDKTRERGASGKRDDVGYAWLMKPDDDPETFTLIQSKKRSRGTAGAFTFRRETDEGGRLRFVPTADSFDVSVGRLMAVLDELGIDRSAGERKVKEALTNANRSIPVRPVLRVALQRRKEIAEAFDSLEDEE